MKITDHTCAVVTHVEELDTGAFMARILRNGKHVLDVKYDGRGGVNRYYSASLDLVHEKQALHEHASRTRLPHPADDAVQRLRSRPG